jgi:hypothetical protein
MCIIFCYRQSYVHNLFHFCVSYVYKFFSRISCVHSFYFYKFTTCTNYACELEM